MASVYRRGDYGRWRIEYRDAMGRRRTVTAPEGLSKRAADRLARQLEADAFEALGGETFAERRRLPVLDVLEDFLAALASRGRSSVHLARVRAHLERLIEAAGWAQLGELDPVDLERHLARLASDGLAARTRNAHRASAFAFGRWLTERRRLPANPFASVATARVEADRRRVRRALTHEEEDRLLLAVRTRPGTSDGDHRALLYRFALATGLRRGELKRLAWADLVLDGPRPLVRIAASSAKARKAQAVPLRSDLVLAMRAAKTTRRGRPPFDVAKDLHRLFGRDLTAAGIATPDESGRVLDFHALRLTFITRLAEAGVHPRVAQELARHSTAELTMRVYTDVSAFDLGAAVELTRAPPSAHREIEGGA